MNILTRGLMAALAVLCVGIGSAQAQERFDWTGWFIHGNVGGASADGSLNLTGPGVAATTSLNDSSVTFGGGFGWNLQSDDFVLGFVGDFNYLDIEDSATSLFANRLPVSADVDMPWFATIRGRAGIAFDRTYAYATGGLLLTEVELNTTSVAGSTSRDETLAALTVGAGVEHAFTDIIVGGLEYLYADLGRHSVTNQLGFTATVNPELHILRATLSVRLCSFAVC